MTHRIRFRASAVILYAGMGLVLYGFPAATLFLTPFDIPFGIKTSIVAAMLTLPVYLMKVSDGRYLWVELDGNILRGRWLLGGKVVERTVGDISAFTWIGLGGYPLPGGMPADKRRIYGLRIEFTDGVRLLLSHWEMVALRPFLVELAERVRKGRMG